eukprot:c6345_g1_i1.p1 GENE.c6345_g1_i1~~c6345_g1_i1.p1  ORF type:complete len:355 (-),score=87.82 c6345_g1_i1:68-1132(-)
MRVLCFVLIFVHVHGKISSTDFTSKLSNIANQVHVEQQAQDHQKRAQFASKLTSAVSQMHLKQRLKDVIQITKSIRCPVVLFHGLNEDASSMQVLSRWIRFALPGIYVYILELGDRFDTYFTNMNRQVAATCELLQRNDRLSNGFNIIGFGHGALLARGYLERCNSPPVLTYISIAGPQSGIFQMPAVHDEHADFVLQGGAYEEWSQEYLAPAQYFRHPMKPSLYLRESSFIADINNERPIKNATYKENVESLKAMVLVKFSKDAVIVPRESCWFGYFKPFNVDEMIGMKEMDVYKEDTIGLKKLEREKRLHLLECEGAHQEFSRGWFYANILPFLNTTIDISFTPNTVQHTEL